jgi:hypothetical protein
MSSLYGDYSTIKSGAYGSLMKSYVKKVGNKNALNAYRETGSTTTATDSVTSGTTTKKTSASKSNFLDNYFAEKSSSNKKASTTTEAASTTETQAATTTDKYAKYKSSWLDDQIKQYDKDANKTTAADTSVSMDTTI